MRTRAQRIMSRSRCVDGWDDELKDPAIQRYLLCSKLRRGKALEPSSYAHRTRGQSRGARDAQRSVSGSTPGVSYPRVGHERQGSLVHGFGERLSTPCRRRRELGGRAPRAGRPRGRLEGAQVTLNDLPPIDLAD